VEIEIAQGDEKICLKRTQPQQATFTTAPMITSKTLPEGIPPGTSEPTQDISTSADDGLIHINSPIVGTFYRAASPDSDPFADVGSAIEPQDVVCIIEAMKVMNEIKAEISGTITEVLVKNGQAVEYGQPLFKVKPS
jgi:acetyl-CoA carboxylase biotin carboxyl carrier protein